MSDEQQIVLELPGSIVVSVYLYFQRCFFLMHVFNVFISMCALECVCPSQGKAVHVPLREK